jgi:GNAT superfamily N-acetyltransferase
MLRIDLVTATQHAQAVLLLQAQFDEHQISLSSGGLDRAVAGLIEMPERGVLLLALDGDVPVGLAALSYTWTLEHGGLVAWLDELYVIPERRGQGVGTALLGAARKLATGAGCAAIDLEVDGGHRRAESLYQRAGFEPLNRSRWALRLAPSR